MGFVADKAPVVQGFLCIAYFGLALSVSLTNEMFLVHIPFVWNRRNLILANDSVVKQTVSVSYSLLLLVLEVTAPRNDFQNGYSSFQICDAVSLGHIQGDLNLHQ